MKILCESGIVTSRPQGKWTHYRLNPAGREEAMRLLCQLTTPVVEEKVSCARCKG